MSFYAALKPRALVLRVTDHLKRHTLKDKAAIHCAFFYFLAGRSVKEEISVCFCFCAERNN